MSREGNQREPVTARSILIPVGIGLFLALAAMLFREDSPGRDEEAFWRALCDALTVPGVLLTCFGLLSLVSEQGAFDGIGFTVRKAFGQIRSEAKRAQMPKTYYDYVTGKQETQRKKPLGTLYVGLAFLALAAAALAVYLAKF